MWKTRKTTTRSDAIRNSQKSAEKSPIKILRLNNLWKKINF